MAKTNVTTLFCKGCGGQIVEKFYLQTDDDIFHGSCLRCDICLQRMEDAGSCYKRNERFYCQRDYWRIFCQRKCNRCHIDIGNEEMVMRVLDRVFHVSCFVCRICCRTLHAGEHFLLVESQLFCEDELKKNGDFPKIFSSVSVDQRISFLENGVTMDSSMIQRSRTKGILVDSRRPLLPLEQERYVMMSLNKKKRLRTSFKHHQVRVMRTYFSLNHNPDTKDLKTLSEKTGLSKRVLQVWFQNARAKFRRDSLGKSDKGSRMNEDLVDCSLSVSDYTSSQEMISKENESEDGNELP